MHTLDNAESTPSTTNPNGTSGPEAPGTTPGDILTMSGLAALPVDASPEQIAATLANLAAMLGPADDLTKETTRGAAVRLLTERRYPRPQRMLDLAFKSASTSASEPPPAPADQMFDEPDPWPEPVAGSMLLTELVAVLQKHVSFTEDDAVSVALWIMFTYAFVIARVAPILNITSPEKGCGKSTLLGLVAELASRTVTGASVTSAVLYRMIEKYRPTLVLDEVDTFLASKSEMVGILNVGHTQKAAKIWRTDMTTYEPRAFTVWCPKAFAGIGHRPETLEHRAISIRLRKALLSEKIVPVEYDVLADDLRQLRRKLLRWARDNMPTLKGTRSEVPEELDHRARDNWRLLLAIADLAGDQWPQMARRAAVRLSASPEASAPSEGVELLADIASVLKTWRAEKIGSEQLSRTLVALEARPWRDKGLSAGRMARMLSRYVRPDGLPLRTRDVWIDNRNVKGYNVTDFADAIARYVPQARETLEPLSDNNLARYSIREDAEKNREDVEG